MNKDKLLIKVKDININDFCMIGSVSHFNKIYPNLLKYINEYTIDMQLYSPNKHLNAKLLFLQKYNGNINKIIVNNKLMIFDTKVMDFKEANINSAKKQWKKCNDELSKITDFYTKQETINLLKNNYQKYYGKSGNRKLLKDDKKLYQSLYYYTSNLDKLNKNLNKLTSRLYILINNIDIYCHIHKCLKFWKFKDGQFNICCGKCEPKYPSIEWFKKTYKDNWEKYYNERKLTVSNNKTNSLAWFKIKYGDDLGMTNYNNYVINKMNILSELKANKYSKISQELFWNIYNKLKQKDNCYFFELNQEYVLRIPEKYNHNNVVMMLDFKQNKKIIEYNGNYWHNKDKDDIRYSILRDMGYEIFIVTSDEYNRNIKNNLIIDKCINFLEC